MVECIPAGETTTATTCGEARDGIIVQCLMTTLEAIGKAGKAVAIGGINRIEALLAATVRERRPVGISEALDRKQRADRLQYRLDKALILVRIKVPLQAWNEEAMCECRATVVSKAARTCLQKGEAVPVRAMSAVAVKG
jgi:hypothetical protein